MLLFALYFLCMGSHPSLFIYKVFLSFLLSLVIHPPCIPYFWDHLSVINHPTLSLVKINAVVCLALDPFILFHAIFSFIYLSTIIHSPINFIQFFSFIYFSSVIQQNLIHWFVIVIHPMFTMQLSFVYPSSFTSWVFFQFELILKIHPLCSLAHQTTILIIKADLRGHDHHFSIKSKKWNWHTTLVLKTVFFNFKSPPTKPPGF